MPQETILTGGKFHSKHELNGGDLLTLEFENHEPVDITVKGATTLIILSNLFLSKLPAKNRKQVLVHTLSRLSEGDRREIMRDATEAAAIQKEKPRR